MKRLLAFGLGVAMLFAGAVAFTQDAKAPGASDKAAATPSSIPTAEQLDLHIKRMQAMHDKMLSAATPEERQKAMDEARKEMQAGMMMMQPMMQGGGMMGGGMMGGGMTAQKGKSTDTRAQMQMMGKRMDMMQMMMQMMMDQQGMAGPPKAPESAPKK